MSHTRVKTTYEVEGPYASTDTVDLYCHHNHSCDCTTFYYIDGSVPSMSFCEWIPRNDLWSAMQRLWFPFKEEWGKELLDGVEYYHKAPWEEEK